MTGFVDQKAIDAGIEAIKQRQLTERVDDPRTYRGPIEPGIASVAGWIVYLLLAARDGGWMWASSQPAAAAFPAPPPSLALAAAVLPWIGLLGCVLAIAHLLDWVPRTTGVAGALLALAGSSYPGVAGFGPIGFLLGLAGLIVLLIHQFLRRYPPWLRV
jgi:hypothetical protein